MAVKRNLGMTFSSGKNEKMKHERTCTFMYCSINAPLMFLFHILDSVKRFDSIEKCLTSVHPLQEEVSSK